jgi:hypothetical protein
MWHRPSLLLAAFRRALGEGSLELVAMPEPTFALTADDDLPRTIRRERDAQREAREREARELQARERRAAAASPVPAPALDGGEALALPPPGVAVVDLDVPFARLSTFFIKAVFAAVPALLILTAMLWLFGQALQTFFPQLLKLKILIYMPQ